MKKKKDMFSDLSNAGIGLAGLGMTTAIGAGVAAKAQPYMPEGSPSLTEGFGTIASFAGLGTTIVGGKSVLKAIKKMK